MVGPVPSAFVRRLAALAVLAVPALVLGSSCRGGSAEGTRVLGRTVEQPSVAGVVRRNGAPVAGARVSLDGVGQTTVTDASGSYRLEAVEPGSYRLVVLHGGDDTPVCGGDGTCITAQSARHGAVDVVVGDEPVEADIDL